MASTETNDSKREAMAAIMAEVLGARGWSPKDLAVYLNVSSSAVSSWKLGKSMGTNFQRAMLISIPHRHSPAVGERLAALRASKVAEVAFSKAQAEKYAGTDSAEWAARRLAKAERILAAFENAIAGWVR